MNLNIALYLSAYLISGIPFGLILAKLFGGVDIRRAGSGNIGATNVLRVLKERDPKLAKKLSIITVLLDALKGVAVLSVAKLLGADDNVLWTIAVLSVIGHCFSPFLKFEGGKGVATSLGVFMFMLPIETIISIATWFIVGKVLKISSISSLIGLLVFVLSSFIIHQEIPEIDTHAPIIVIAFVVFYKHIPNIVRLLKREESRVV